MTISDAFLETAAQKFFVTIHYLVTWY